MTGTTRLTCGTDFAPDQWGEGDSADSASGAELFEFHEEQHENRPYSDRQRKLRQRSVPQRTSSRQEIRRRHHGESSKYSKSESSPVHPVRPSLLVCDFAEIVHLFCPSGILSSKAWLHQLSSRGLIDLHCKTVLTRRSMVDCLFLIQWRRSDETNEVLGRMLSVNYDCVLRITGRGQTRRKRHGTH